MQTLEDAVDELADRTGFSGVVRVDRARQIEFAKAYGLADRGHGIPNTIDTQFGIASGTKGLTALTVVSLIEDGSLDLTTTARSVLGEDLPLIDDDVTVEHLLSHRSGIGDYLDEEAGHEITDYVMPVSVHELATTEQYLAVLGGHPHRVRTGRAVRVLQRRLRRARVDRRADERHAVPRARASRACASRRAWTTPSSCAPTSSPGRAALGYLTTDGSRTNVFHLPVRGSGDGGIYSTAADISSLWSAFFAGRIVSKDWVAEMVRPRSDVPRESMRYGLGFWLHASSDVVVLAWIRCRRLVPQHARPRLGDHPYRDLEHDRGSVADRGAPRRPAGDLTRGMSSIAVRGIVVDEDVFNMSVRRFLKTLGVTAQREIEVAVREQLATGALQGSETLEATATVTVRGLPQDVVVTGKIALS